MNRIDGGVGVAGTSQGDGIVGRGGAQMQIEHRPDIETPQP